MGIIEKVYKLKSQSYFSESSPELKESKIKRYFDYLEKELKNELEDDEGEDINFGVLNTWCICGYNMKFVLWKNLKLNVMIYFIRL